MNAVSLPVPRPSSSRRAIAWKTLLLGFPLVIATVAVLRDYAEKLQAQPRRWDFLTGSKAAIYDLSRNGFKLAIDDGSKETGLPVHSTRMALIDRHGVIRGYYDATAPDTVTKLLADTNHLLREQPR